MCINKWYKFYLYKYILLHDKSMNTCVPELNNDSEYEIHIYK